MNKDKNFEFCNLIQQQNLLDLELHELRPILYSKFLNLFKIENLAAASLDSIFARNKFDNQVIRKSKGKRTILLDDRCIVGKVLSVLNNNIQ